MADGAILSNEGRGYVLRRLLRRAGRFGKKLGMDRPFLYRLVPVAAEIMKEYYPYLTEKTELLAAQIKREEEKFLQTLETGENRLLEFIASAPGKTVPGEIAFLLYDTFGFPMELTLEVAGNMGLTSTSRVLIASLRNKSAGPRFPAGRGIDDRAKRGVFVIYGEKRVPRLPRA